MLPVAFTPSTWTATLRRIARTAVASLVLIAGLQGIAAAPAHAAVAGQADATTVRTAGFGATDARATSTEFAPSAIASPVAAGTTTADGAPRTATGPAADAAVTDSASAGRMPGVEAVAVADPARAAIARRGPPRA
ncbi:hypothetical protein AB0K27_00980 [Micromonospora echinospora]|uniref:Uncharacterized protein n=1 Tax=Micromonospora echinospora TaxID=1877 RepID=A0ABR6M7E6_MICEC|nr:hypothetical protein [Micromonospora echinospora]MBB5111270.1 hypothetical protein [Micromonospora echinospora]